MRNVFARLRVLSSGVKLESRQEGRVQREKDVQGEEGLTCRTYRHPASHEAVASASGREERIETD